MLSIFAFLIILGPLVVVHEFGHYLFAKLFNVKAEAFSVGFGPKLWARYFGETEFRLSLIPLGGYVKLLGEEPDSEMSEADRKRALYNAAPWKRFFIFFGGPLFNFIFAILVFMAILILGEPHLGNRVGRVTEGSFAEKVGFHSGDRILSIDSEKTRLFSDIIVKVHESPGQTLDFELDRNGSTVHLEVKPQVEEGYSIYGEEQPVGVVDGLLPLARTTRMGVSNPKSIAGKNGLRTGDEIISLNGEKVSTWADVDRLYKVFGVGGPVKLRFRTEEGEEKEVTFMTRKSASTPGEDWGIYSSELFVEQTVLDSPAQKAGIQKGDRLVRVGSVTVRSFYELKDQIQLQAQKTGKVKISWERDGKISTQEIAPTASNERDPTLKKLTTYTIGVVPQLKMAEGEMVVERVWNPFKLVFVSTQRMLTFTWRNLVSLSKMVTGDVSVKTLGGPILIGKIAGDSLSRGLIAFLTTMAILSVGLGFLNILPIPVLDGGHLLLLLVEIVRGKPLTLHQMAILQNTGLFLILTLMAVVMRNDIYRLFAF